MRVRAGNHNGLLRPGKLLLGRVQIAFRHARGSFDGIELKFGDVVGGEQRSVARQIGLRAIVGGAFCGYVGLGDLQIRGGGLFELRLGTGVIGGIGFLLSSAPLVLLCGSFARQTDLDFRGICLRLREIQIGFGLRHFCLYSRGSICTRTSPSFTGVLSLM